MNIKVTVYTNRDGIEVSFPAKWEICGACEGNATTTRHIECDGGGFTASEFAEACDDDPDFADDYFSGRYDEPCPDCKGLGRVQEIDHDTISAFGSWREKILWRAYCKQERDNAEIDAMQAAEMRMGA